MAKILIETEDDWKSVVSHMRAEFVRFFPSIHQSNIGVRRQANGMVLVSLYAGDEGGDLHSTWVEHMHENAWHSFSRQGHRGTITIPLWRRH